MAETAPRSVRYGGEYFHHFNISSPWLLAILFSPALRVCGLRLPRCSSLRFCHPPSPWEHLVCCCCPPRLAHCQRLRKPRTRSSPSKTVTKRLFTDVDGGITSSKDAADSAAAPSPTKDA
uniref:Uncharacterized protein n=1 Tax=Zea mays TaxID=4577 RepID=B6TDN8_MAIZE|nr:hypothetical protein [Zea mays]ACG39082.1 hypothetical protein [Zea mays]